MKSVCHCAPKTKRCQIHRSRPLFTSVGGPPHHFGNYHMTWLERLVYWDQPGLNSASCIIVCPTNTFTFHPHRRLILMRERASQTRYISSNHGQLVVHTIQNSQSPSFLSDCTLSLSFITNYHTPTGYTSLNFSSSLVRYYEYLPKEVMLPKALRRFWVHGGTITSTTGVNRSRRACNLRLSHPVPLQPMQLPILPKFYSSSAQRNFDVFL